MSDIQIFDYTPDLISTLEKQGKQVRFLGRVRSTTGNYPERIKIVSEQAEELNATAIMVTTDSYQRGPSVWLLAGNAVILTDVSSE
jgi:hypothetical protein